MFVPWTTTRNLEECLRFMDDGGLVVEPLITHRVPIDEAPDACEDLIERPNEALGVIPEFMRRHYVRTEAVPGGSHGRTGGGDYGHGLHLGFLGAEQVDFVVVADPDEAGRQKVAEATGAERTYADYREMLEKEGLDLVTVGPRWVDCREEMVTACVEAGAMFTARSRWRQAWRPGTGWWPQRTGRG